MNSNRSRTARVIAVASGKGGVGKTNVSVNLAVALARLGQKTMLVDCDMGLANANILLGLNSNWTIADLLARHCELSDIIQTGPAGIALVPGHSGTGVGSVLSAGDRDRLRDALAPYGSVYDQVIVDTGSGIADEALQLVAAADLSMIILSPEPTSFMDAYALVKALFVNEGRTSFCIVTNMVENDEAGQRLFAQFEAVITRFMDVRLTHAGSIPDDPYVREAVYRKRCCVEAFPSSRAGRAFTRLAKQMATLATTNRPFFGREALHGAC